MAFSIHGIYVSKGIALGKSFLWKKNQPNIEKKHLADDLIDDEIERFNQALNKTQNDLHAIALKLPSSTTADVSEFVDAHLLMLKDFNLSSIPIKLIRENKCNAEWALNCQRKVLLSIFDEMDDAYLKTRKDDVNHVINSVQQNLHDGSNDYNDFYDVNLKHKIVIAEDFSPAEIILMHQQGIGAFVTEYGGYISHTAILARSFGLPAIVGVKNICHYIGDNERLVVDGFNGVVFSETDELVENYFINRINEEKLVKQTLAKLVDSTISTQDAVSVKLNANIEGLNDISSVKKLNADGVGLYRTEFLFLNRQDIPGEEEQVENYVAAITALAGKPLVLRTLDIGGDKTITPDYIESTANPALSLRAIRLCLNDLKYFLPQIRAILRASATGPVQLMVPMLTNLNELKRVNVIIDQAKSELSSEGYEFDEKIKIGGMIEVPAAALLADAFAKELDFLSIGTNDLIQYTLAIDRMDDKVNYLYDPSHPAVLQLIKKIIDAGEKHQIPVTMCGDMAGDVDYIRLLLGLGLREFSMSPSSLLEVKQIVKNTDISKIKSICHDLLTTYEHDKIRQSINGLNS
ncbi:MAG: phosphoenolpyruvate--protein phosphotransferase [Methylococcales bacterium]|jgi:phosphoenolpyruvate-protein phosphotransferase (PTS system enzyme I)|nr:phosphoenolpyruvate--protein phosphotransferase [Methylococcales bacterium]MBT7410243.1 phosphoenolpyruvate--protein phosphotransferase [Methylococcales bacterium]